jgi:hypothetical protein
MLSWIRGRCTHTTSERGLEANLFDIRMLNGAERFTGRIPAVAPTESRRLDIILYAVSLIFYFVSFTNILVVGPTDSEHVQMGQDVVKLPLH